MNADLTLDEFNTGTIQIRDNSGNVLRFTITVDNIIGNGLSLNVSAWDRDNFGTPDEKIANAVFSFNCHDDRQTESRPHRQIDERDNWTTHHWKSRESRA